MIKVEDAELICIIDINLSDQFSGEVIKDLKLKFEDHQL